MDDRPTRITLLQQREIEARIVSPLIAAFREELGEERTLAVLERVVEQLARDSGAELADPATRGGSRASRPRSNAGPRAGRWSSRSSSSRPTGWSST